MRERKGEDMNPYSQVTPKILELAEVCQKNSSIDPSLYAKYDVKRGLRDIAAGVY